MRGEWDRGVGEYEDDPSFTNLCSTQQPEAEAIKRSESRVRYQPRWIRWQQWFGGMVTLMAPLGF